MDIIQFGFFQAQNQTRPELIGSWFYVDIAIVCKLCTVVLGCFYIELNKCMCIFNICLIDF